MSVRKINKLGEEINSIKNQYESDINSLLYNLPRSIDIITSKKHKVDLIYLKEYEDQGEIYEEIIKKYKLAWFDMLKLLEEFAIKEQGKKKIVKKPKRGAKKK